MTSPPIILPREGVIPREGEIAFAVSVSTLYDLTLGRINWPVRLLRPATLTPMTPPLTLGNRVPGGACLDILDPTFSYVVTRFTNRGIYQTQVNGWIDFEYQDEGDPPGTFPPSPGAGSEMLRVYARDGHLYFKAEDNLEQEIPLVAPDRPPINHAYWMAGG